MGLVPCLVCKVSFQNSGKVQRSFAVGGLDVIKNVALLAISVHNFIKMLKKGLKTDLKLKKFPKFSNRISGSSSGDNESKIHKSLLLIWAPKRS